MDPGAVNGLAPAPDHTPDTGLHADRLARGRVRDLFLRVLGGILVVAFLSLAVQMPLLVGDHGLLPARDLLAQAGGFLDAPTVFRWIAPTDGALVLTAVAGALLGVSLMLGVAPRWCLAGAWALYLSLVTVGQD